MKNLFLILVSVLICGSAAAQQNSSNDEAQPLVVVKNAEGKTYKVDDMKSIDNNAIESVTVIKNEAARAEFAQYGDTSEGVVYIKLKAQPLVVVKNAEGKTYKVDDMKSIDNNAIESVTVMKSEAARAEFAQYGDTSGGVIYIKLK